MKIPLITIVTPSFNQGQFIEQTIRSVWDQAGNFKIQHLVADGGSSDQTVTILKKLERQLREGEYSVKCKQINFKWWSKPDKGQADALNQGFELARGEYFGWLNSDDYYQPGALQKVVQYFEEHPDTDLIYGDMNFVNKKGKLIQQCPYLIDFNFQRLLNSCYICQPSTFFRRKVYQRVGLFNSQFHYVFDYDYWIRVGQNFRGKLQRVHLGVLANLRTYPERKTERGLLSQRKETLIMLWQKKLILNWSFWGSLAIVTKGKLSLFGR